MTVTNILTKINRSDSFPYIKDVSISGRSYISIKANDWTAQMFYELPCIKFDIYTNQNGTMCKYNQNSYTIDTSSGLLEDAECCLEVKNIPSKFYLYISPIFDSNAIAARNALIRNGIEDGDIWDSITDTFNITINIISD